MATIAAELIIAVKLLSTEFEKGSNAVTGKLKDIAGAAKTADEAGAGKKLATGLESVSTQLSRIQQLYVGIQAVQGLGSGIADITRRADEYKNLAARVKLVSDTTGEAATAQAALFDIAQKQQVAVPELTQLYVRLAGSMRSMGRDQTESLQVTEAVTLGLRISGASAQESASAMLQLSQAFGSGTLRGEEFNAVNEASPRLMQALADGMGVAKESLRGLAEDGKITSQVMGDALIKALAQLKAEAATLPETVGGAFTRMSNALTRYIGEADKSSGASARLAGAVGAVADNLPKIANVAIALAVGALAGALTRTAIAGAMMAKEAFQVSVASAAAARGVATLGTAAAVTAGSMGLLARGLGTVSALVGGPIGLALAAIGVAWALLSDQQAKGEAAADEMTQKQKAVTEALRAERVKLVSLEKQAASEALDGWVKSYDQHKQFLDKHLAESLQAEEKHVAKLKTLRAGLVDFEGATADTLRELNRKGMGESEAAADLQLEIAEKLQAAQKAATEGRYEDAEAAAKQAQQLAAQTGNTQKQIEVVKQAAEIVKTSKAAEIAATEQALKAQQSQTAAFRSDIAGVEAALKSLDAMRPKPKIDADIEQAKANIAALEKRLAEFAATPTVKTVQVVTVGGGDVAYDGSVDTPGLDGWAAGGPIRGPGSGTSDSILARVSNGEYVVRAAAVQRYGSGFMDAINRMALPKFADGGKVGAGGTAAAAMGGIVIENLNLPGISNAREFVAELRQMLRTDPGLLSPGFARAG